MIANWRSDFKNNRLPFYFVQISPHRSQHPEIRDAQLYALNTVPYTGMVVTTDNGDSMDIHPRNKKLVGERLSLWALKNEYGKKKVIPSGPLYQSAKINAGKITISFKYADGLTAKDGALKEFMIAGDDQQFVPAKAIVEGNKIVVWSDAVAKPVAVRFAWSNVPRPNLYNGMIAPIVSYTMKGVIWYQGESNADRAYQYRKLFPAMIANWRSDFKNNRLPFYFVQISPHRSQHPEIRDAQLYTLNTVPNTGMAVTTDNGDSMDIHPRNKKLVGERLSLWALKNEYGKNKIIPSGPLYQSAKITAGNIIISF